MRVSLVVPADPPGLNAFNQVPIGTLYTAGELDRRGVDVAFYDLRVTADDERTVYRDIVGADLAVVVSNDYDLAQCYPSLAPTADCVSRIKAAGDLPVVCAGSHATVEPAMTRSFTGADSAVRGEFEFAIPALVRWLETGNPWPSSWPADSQALADESMLANLGPPAYHLAPMSRYASEGFNGGQLERVNSGLVLANRGCPFGCSFCYLLFGRPLRRRPVDATIAELRAMHTEHGIRHFFFLDYTFTIDPGWVRALCDEIRAARLDISWICQTRVDCLDEATLQVMQGAGCAGVWLGVESPELEQRRYLSKGRISFDHIEAAIEMIRRSNLEALAFVMVGLPNETVESLASLNRWLDESQVFYSLSTFQRRIGAPLSDRQARRPSGWAYLDEKSDELGESALRLSELGWFFEWHQQHPNRVANLMRRPQGSFT